MHRQVWDWIDRLGACDPRCLCSAPVRLVGRLFVAISVAALLAGCGGTYTRRDFIARADAICVSAVRAARSLTPPAGQQLGALTGYLGEVLPIVRSESKQIHALRRPVEGARNRTLLASYLAALGQVVSDYEELAAAARRGDGAGAARAEEALRASPVTSLAASYGLSACAAPGATVA